MKNLVIFAIAAGLAAALAVAAARNRALDRELVNARAELDAMRDALASAERAKPGPPPRKRAVEDKGIPRPAAPQPAAETGEDFDKAVEKRVSERMETMRREREEQREAWRRERENETPEQREARRKEFQERMQEHSAAQIRSFIEKAGLDEAQSAAFEGELAALDERVREIANVFAEDIGNGAKFDFETQAQLIYNMSAAVMDAYAGLDEVLPGGWRERDEEFNVLFGIGADAMNPLFDTLRQSGAHGMRGFPFMPHPPRRDDAGRSRRGPTP